MAGTCECGNEPMDSIKCGEFLDYVKTGLLFKDSTPWSKLCGVAWHRHCLVLKSKKYPAEVSTRRG